MDRKITPLFEFGVDESILAHTSKTNSKSYETLFAHSGLTYRYFEKIIESKSLQTILDDLIKKIDYMHHKLIDQMFKDAIYLHDLGKKNPYFQAKKMGNPHFEAYQDSTTSSEHSKYSADEYIKHYLVLIEDKQKFNRFEREKLKYILYSFSYHMAKHHGRLSQFEKYKTEDKKAQSYRANLDKLKIHEFEFYILNKLLFSLLVSSDYYATTEYMADFPIDSFGTFSQEAKEQLKDKFDHYIGGFPKPAGINKLRNEMFQEAENNLLQNLDKNIFYLEAPTGSGKTITSINLALQLLTKDEKLNKLFYIFPFNTLVEQTKSVFEEIFENSLDMQVVNAITPIKEAGQEEEESKYEKSYINRLFFHAPAIITTHVSLFNILFGTSKEDNFPLWQLANSVIIIDEVQSYNNKLWWYMIEFFDKYAKLLNIKIIIMSATLPKLDYFLEKNDGFVDLIADRDYYYKNPLFRDRVIVDFSLLDEGKISFDQLEEVLEEEQNNYQKILFEFIKKQSAREFFEQIKDRFKDVYELSGDDNKAYRQLVINKTKEDKSIIVIATQVIEAGVDIDMDLGFKDISTLDSEEQFMGRINRSCKNSGRKVYFFDLDEASDIYRGDHRIEFDLKQDRYRKILEDKNYQDFYAPVLKNIENSILRLDNGLENNIENFKNYIKRLNYQEISKTMTLINSQNFTLYFPFKIDISIYKGIKEFEDMRSEYLTDGYLDGQKVWDEYLKLREIESFTKKEYKRSYINSLMQFFTFSIIKFDEKSRPCIGEEIGGYYYIKNYDEFVEEGKFNREAYQKKCKNIFL